MKATYFILALALAACGGGATTNSDPVEDTVHEEVKGTLTSLVDEDMPLQVLIPEGQEATIVWREEFGHIEVRAGERFGLIITEEPGDMGRKKADLQRDLLQTHTILDESESSMIYKSQFPDSEKLTFHHLYEVINVGDRSFVVTDIQDGKFSENDVMEMRTAVSSIAA